MPVAHDLLPALLLPALVLLALAVFMPFTGGRETRRREAWARFDALTRIRGIGAADRDVLARWAQLACPEAPHHVLVRRQDFDRFARGEVRRAWSADAATRKDVLERTGSLRRTLGFDRSPGLAVSTHDVLIGELLTLRRDVGGRVVLRVVANTEEGLAVEPVAAGQPSLGSGWATFARAGEGTYRFRTAPVRAGLCIHGEFLLRGDRRRDPRILMARVPFWVAVERLPDGAAPEDPEGVEVEAVDLSTGGLALLADREVRRGSELWLDLPLGDGQDGPSLRGVRARVLGSGFREGGGSRPHFLHCAFLALTRPQQQVLESFVWSRSASKPSNVST